ncbi:carbohydrate ABC transporter permease [Streptomyces sp. TLI_171]|uniref:carbohydrate ABC transporter permease n=1 Tax=Streptomyces sp. TLI_171 TaxID=1938859 RepID=UPI000C6A3EE1|nr:sugar ABC transporter permease [Streptomyces sp. TLI_171]RKE21074.1 N,N'-diacetylchitobiose transport system permease protein [Streptomyces sp. TLI_171]
MSVTTDETVIRSESSGPAPVEKPQRRGFFAAGQYIPYALLLPAVIALVGVLAYPLYSLFDLSFKNVNRYAYLVNPALSKYIGFDGYTKIFKDSQFWEVVLRSVYFTAELVVLSMVLGMLIALLLNRVSNWVKVTIITVLMFVWAIPALVTGQVFRWLFSSTGGVVDYLAYLVTGDESWKHYDWFADPTVGLFVVGAAVIIWGALPFLVLGMNAALTQVPKELMEAAELDGASVFQAFRHVTLPVIRPFLMISAALSFIWDFQVFAQIFSLRNTSPEPEYWTIGTFLYEKGIVASKYSDSSVISLVMIIMMLAVLVFYIRQMLKIGANER